MRILGGIGRSGWAAGLAGFVLRLVLFLLVQPWRPDVEQRAVLQPHRDVVEYHALARSMVESGRYVYPTPRDPRAARPFQVEALRVPAYPAFIGLFYAVVGPRPWVVLLAQLLLDAVTCVFVGAAAGRLFGPSAGAVSAWAYALHPVAVLFSLTLLSDTLLVFWCAAGLLALAHGAASRFEGWRPVAVAALCFGGAALTKPVVQFIPVVVAGYFFWMLRGIPRPALARAALFAVLFAATLVPWMLYNRARYDAFALSTSGAFNALAFYAVPLATTEQSSDGEVLARLLRRADAEMARDGIGPEPVNDFVRAPYWARAGRRAVLMHPLRAAGLQGRGMGRLFFSPGRKYRDHLFVGGGSSAVWHGLADAYALAYLVGSAMLLGAGVVRAWRRPTREAWVLCAAVAAYFAVLTGAAGHSRFHLPLLPFTLPLIATGALTIADRLRRRLAQRP